jgi:hypothetical protein
MAEIASKSICPEERKKIKGGIVSCRLSGIPICL